MAKRKQLSGRQALSGKIIPVMYDECGKRIFRNELVCKYFLSDVLLIPVEKMKRIKFLDTHLFRRYRNQKLGILDILVELNDNTKINIEIQIRPIKAWEKRQMFYLSRLYTGELMVSENYAKLKRCIGICILDFNYSEQEEYHRVYRFQDEKGNLFSEDFELHTIELKKKLQGKDSLDDWIRLFNARSEEELDMIKTKNIGIREAIQEVRRYSLIGFARELYEDHLKYVRDKAAIEAYMCEEATRKGLEEGIAQGMEQGIAQGMEQGIAQGKAVGMTQGKADAVLEILESYGEVPNEVRELILGQKDREILSNWLKIAVKAENVEEFAQKVVGNSSKI